MLFSAPMVRAILDDSRTQLRRVMKQQPTMVTAVGRPIFHDENNRRISPVCPYGQPGDRLWVRETFQLVFADGFEHVGATFPDYGTGYGYKCNYPATDGRVEFIDGDGRITDRVTPSIRMPRWASRILLEIVSVRVERLQDISEEDAKAEGIWRTVSGHFSYGDEYNPSYITAVDAFGALWESINGADSWAANPWVWVVEFKPITK